MIGEAPRHLLLLTDRYANKRNRWATDRLSTGEVLWTVTYTDTETTALGKTKKVRSTGRFGSRYGAKLRRRVLDIEKRRFEAHRCPSCATRALTRKAVGLWNCKKCGLVFAGGAYVPATDAGKAAKRAIAQRVSGDFLALRDSDDIVEPEEFLPNIEEEAVVVATTLENEEEVTSSSEEIEEPE
ncbi:MAG: 50S ribosomal protein L37ae [Candidatus Hodarchaeota archaeon]